MLRKNTEIRKSQRKSSAVRTISFFSIIPSNTCGVYFFLFGYYNQHECLFRNQDLSINRGNTEILYLGEVSKNRETGIVYNVEKDINPLSNRI